MAKTFVDRPVHLITGKAACKIMCGFTTHIRTDSAAHKFDVACLQWLLPGKALDVTMQHQSGPGRTDAPNPTESPIAQQDSCTSQREGGTLLHAAIINTPIGQLLFIADQDKPLLLTYMDSVRLSRQIRKIRKLYSDRAILWELCPIFNEFESALDQYFSSPKSQPKAGILRYIQSNLSTLGTVFQTKVWNHLMTIPAAHTVTYQQLADAIGASSAVRAAASAIGDNPFMILIPCHRVIASNGGLGGYAGGTQAKRRLLDWETQ